MEKRLKNCAGESLVECVVVLALVAILVITVVTGLGQRSSSRLISADHALQGQSSAARPQPSDKDDDSSRRMKKQGKSDSADPSEAR